VLTDDPKRQMARIRLLARTHGLKIRARQTSRGSGQRAYTVLDGATGESLVVAPDLDELKTRLWWVIRQRELQRQSGATNGVARETCPVCGTPRVGALAFCRTCGFDFEPARATVPTTWPVTSTPMPTTSPADSAPVTSRPGTSSLFTSAPLTSSRIASNPIMSSPVASVPAASSRAGSSGIASSSRTAEPGQPASGSSGTTDEGATDAIARDGGFNLLIVVAAVAAIAIVVAALVVLVSVKAT
jgi:hypothetical protein